MALGSCSSACQPNLPIADGLTVGNPASDATEILRASLEIPVTTAFKRRTQNLRRGHGFLN